MNCRTACSGMSAFDKFREALERHRTVNSAGSCNRWDWSVEDLVALWKSEERRAERRKGERICQN